MKVTRRIVPSLLVYAALLSTLLPCSAMAQGSDADRLCAELVQDLRIARRALDSKAALITLDDPYARPDMSERDKVAGQWSFACSGETVRLEKRFVETSSSGLKADLIVGRVMHEGVLYDFQVSVDNPQSRPTSRMEKREMLFPNPRMAVQYEGVPYADLLSKGGGVRCILQGAGALAVAEGEYEGRPFKLVLHKVESAWLLKEAAIQMEAPNHLSKYYLNVSVKKWTRQGDGGQLPASAHVYFGDENNANQDLGRTYLVNEWKDLNESILPQSRISEGSLVIDEEENYFLIGSNGELIPVAGPRGPKTNSWTILYLLSGTGLVLSLGFFLVQMWRRKTSVS